MKYAVRCRVVRLLFIQQLDDMQCLKSPYGPPGEGDYGNKKEQVTVKH
jgi:hypothetical protein